LPKEWSEDIKSAPWRSPPRIRWQAAFSDSHDPMPDENMAAKLNKILDMKVPFTLNEANQHSTTNSQGSTNTTENIRHHGIRKQANISHADIETQTNKHQMAIDDLFKQPALVDLSNQTIQTLVT